MCTTAALVLLISVLVVAIAQSSVESQRRKDVTKMLNLYMKQHSSAAVIAESRDKLCRRKFVANH
jgi:hypothetical protein